jgi:hypothetical protein
MLDVHPGLSAATVEITDPAVVDSETTINVQILDAAGEPFPLELIVRVSVTGANETGILIAEHLGNSLYKAAYTPTQAGTDNIKIEAWGPGILDLTEIGTFTSEVLPLSGDLVVVVEIEGGAPADGLPVYLYQGTDPPVRGGRSRAAAPAGPGRLLLQRHLRRHRVRRLHRPPAEAGLRRPVRHHDQEHHPRPGPQHRHLHGGHPGHPGGGPGLQGERMAATGTPSSTSWGARSWVASNNQVQNDVLLGVQGHLATIHSDGENDFVTGLVERLLPQRGQVRAHASPGHGSGLRFNTTAGAWEWVTGEAFDYTKWEARTSLPPGTTTTTWRSTSPASGGTSTAPTPPTTGTWWSGP